MNSKDETTVVTPDPGLERLYNDQEALAAVKLLLDKGYTGRDVVRAWYHLRDES